MTFIVKLRNLEFLHLITDQDIEELNGLYNSEIIGLKHSIRNSPKDFIKNAEIIKSSTVSLINEILPFSDHFTKKVHSINQEIDRLVDGRQSIPDSDLKEVEKKKRRRLYTIEVAELIDAALCILFELLLENFPDARNNGQIKKIAKDFLPREKQYLIKDNHRENVPELTYAAKSLLLFYNNQELKGNEQGKMVQKFNQLTKPGRAGENERRCTGGNKQALNKRIKDFEAIRSYIKPEGLSKFQADEQAVKKEYEQ